MTTECGRTSGAATEAAEGPLEWFGHMIQNCLDYASKRREEGHPVVGIMCEYCPRELIMAAGGVPVCLCGGSADTIPAAERELPSNLCPLIKSTYGYHLERSNPFLEMADLLIAETTCDGKKKMFELMGRSRPTYVMELTQKEDDGAAFEHWAGEMERLKDYLEERFETTITDGKLREAIGVMNRERRLRRGLAELMKAGEPPLTGRELLELKSSISGIAEDLARYEAALEKFAGGGRRAADPDSVRVLMTGVPIVHGAERVLDIVEGHDGLVVCMENCTGLKPILEDVDGSADDPVRALAEKYFRLPCSLKTPNDRRLEWLRRLAGEYRPECVIELVWQACLTYDVEGCRVRRFCEEELGLPYLRISTDYSPSDSARIAVRVEAFFETVRSRAGAAGGGGSA